VELGVKNWLQFENRPGEKRCKISIWSKHREKTGRGNRSKVQYGMRIREKRLVKLKEHPERCSGWVGSRLTLDHQWSSGHPYSTPEVTQRL